MKAEKEATYPDLTVPTRLDGVKGVDFKFVASGSGTSVPAAHTAQCFYGLVKAAIHA